MMAREKFTTKTITLVSSVQRETLYALVPNLPIDATRPLEVIIREQVKGRKPSQNEAMWAGPLRDIAEQAWLNGRQFCAEVWHEFFKREFLPEEFDAELCKEGFRKWDFDPSGERVLIGSTTQLTIKGMAQYMTQLEAFGGQIGVEYTASPNEARRFG